MRSYEEITLLMAVQTEAIMTECLHGLLFALFRLCTK